MARHSVELYDLSKHPKYATAIGEIFAVWTKIEFRLCHLYAQLLRSPPWLAQAAFYSVVNNRARIDMIKGLAAQLKDANQDKQRVIDLLADVSDAPAARHGYAHKPWLIYKDKVYQMDEVAPHLDFAKKHHVSLKQLRDDLAALKVLDQRLVDFITDYSARNPLTVNLSADDEPWMQKLFPPSGRRGS